MNLGRIKPMSCDVIRLSVYYTASGSVIPPTVINVHPCCHSLYVFYVFEYHERIYLNVARPQDQGLPERGAEGDVQRRGPASRNREARRQRTRVKASMFGWMCAGRIEAGRHEERPIQCWPLPRVDFPWYIAIEPLSASQCPNERLRGRKIQFSF